MVHFQSAVVCPDYWGQTLGVVELLHLGYPGVIEKPNCKAGQAFGAYCFQPEFPLVGMSGDHGMMEVLQALGPSAGFAPLTDGSGSVLHDLAYEKLNWVKNLALEEHVQ